MQQRVAVARALAFGAEIILMDEPFGSLDAQTRAGLQDLLLRLWQEYRLTILFVTHDIDEAIYVSQKVLVLSSAPAAVRAAVVIELELSTSSGPDQGKSAIPVAPAPSLLLRVSGWLGRLRTAAESVVTWTRSSERGLAALF